MMGACCLKYIASLSLRPSQVTDNRSVIRGHRRGSKRHSFVSANSLQIRFKVYCNFDSWRERERERDRE